MSRIRAHSRKPFADAPDDIGIVHTAGETPVADCEEAAGPGGGRREPYLGFGGAVGAGLHGEGDAAEGGELGLGSVVAAFCGGACEV